MLFRCYFQNSLYAYTFFLIQAELGSPVEINNVETFVIKLRKLS